MMTMNMFLAAALMASISSVSEAAQCPIDDVRHCKDPDNIQLTDPTVSCNPNNCQWVLHKLEESRKPTFCQGINFESVDDHPADDRYEPCYWWERKYGKFHNCPDDHRHCNDPHNLELVDEGVECAPLTCVWIITRFNPNKRPQFCDDNNIEITTRDDYPTEDRFEPCYWWELKHGKYAPPPVQETTTLPTTESTSTTQSVTTSPVAQTSTAQVAQTTTAAPVQSTTAQVAQTTTPAPVESTTAQVVQTTTAGPVESTTAQVAQTTTAGPVETTTIPSESTTFSAESSESTPEATETSTVGAVDSSSTSTTKLSTSSTVAGTTAVGQQQSGEDDDDDDDTEGEQLSIVVPLHPQDIEEFPMTFFVAKPDENRVRGRQLSRLFFKNVAALLLLTEQHLLGVVPVLGATDITIEVAEVHDLADDTTANIVTVNGQVSIKEDASITNDNLDDMIQGAFKGQNLVRFLDLLRASPDEVIKRVYAVEFGVPPGLAIFVNGNSDQNTNSAASDDSSDDGKKLSYTAILGIVTLVFVILFFCLVYYVRRRSWLSKAGASVTKEFPETPRSAGTDESGEEVPENIYGDGHAQSQTVSEIAISELNYTGSVVSHPTDPPSQDMTTSLYSYREQTTNVSLPSEANQNEYSLPSVSQEEIPGASQSGSESYTASYFYKKNTDSDSDISSEVWSIFDGATAASGKSSKNTPGQNRSKNIQSRFRNIVSPRGRKSTRSVSPIPRPHFDSMVRGTYNPNLQRSFSFDTDTTSPSERQAFEGNGSAAGGSASETSSLPDSSTSSNMMFSPDPPESLMGRMDDENEDEAVLFNTAESNPANTPPAAVKSKRELDTPSTASGSDSQSDNESYSQEEFVDDEEGPRDTLSLASSLTSANLTALEEPRLRVDVV